MKKVHGLTIVEALPFIRSNPARFFPSGTPSGVQIAEGLAGDALILGASRVELLHEGDWWIVSADLDWIESFTEVVPFPEGGVNSIRKEIFPMAFADALLTRVRAGEILVLKGEPPAGSPIWQILESRGGWARTVAFEFRQR